MKKLLTTALFSVIMFASGLTFAQTSGDWRTIAAGGALTWSNQAHWERFNGSVWVGSPGAYPGQGGADGVVTVRTNGSPTVTLDVSPNSFGSLAVEAGATVAMGANAIVVNNGASGAGTITLSTGTLTVGNSTAANGDISVNTLTATGAASIYLTDSWSVTTFNAGTSTVFLYGATDNDINNSPTFYNLTVAATETQGVTLASNISLANGGALTISANVTFNANNFTVTSLGTNTLTMTTGTIAVTGTFSFGTQFVGFDTVTLSGGTINYNGTSQNVTGMTYYNLTLQGTGATTKTAIGSIVVQLDLTIAADDIFNLQTNNLEVYDDILMGNASSSLTATGGTVTLNTTDQDAVMQNGIYSLHNLTISMQSITALRTATISQNVTLTGNVLFQNPAGSSNLYLSVNIAGFSLTGTGGANTFGLGEHVRLRTTTTDISTFMNTFESLSDGINPGGFSSDSYVVFESAAPQTIPVLSGNYGGISLNSGFAKTASGNLVITGPLFMANTVGQSFDDGGFVITVGGNFTKSANTALTSTGTFSFAGASQTITINGSPTFNNIEFLGSTTSTIIPGANFTVAGDFTIASGPTVNFTTNNFTMFFTGSTWSVAGLFQPTTGTINFSGAGAQTLDMFSTGNDVDAYFYNLTISNTSVPGVTATQDFEIQQDFTLAASAVFSISGRTMYVGDDWVRNAGATIDVTGSTVIFDGGAQQDISSGGVAFNSITMRNAGTKTLANNNSLVLNGDLNIEGGANFDNDISDEPISIAGNWNNFGTYVPGQATVTFNGVNQSLGGIFYSIQLSNSGIKSLNAQIDIDGILTVDSGVELDVTTGNYTIALNGSVAGTEWGFVAGSIFTPRQGLVTFSGGAKTATTQGMPFYNLTINMTAATSIVVTGNVDVDNDLNIQSGIFNFQANTLTVGGDLFVDTPGTGTLTGTGLITLDAASGSVNTNFGTTAITAPIVVSSSGGAVYSLTGSLNSTYNNVATSALIVNSGTLTLNGVTATFSDVSSTILINGGTLNVSDNGTISLPNAGVITNNGGSFLVVGTAGNLATVSGTTTGYTVVNTSGTFGAQYFVFNQLTGNGIQFNGGSIHATYTLNFGTFGDHRGGALGNYLTIAADPGTPVTASNVSFSQGLATYNVERSDNGANTFTFVDANGAFAGDSFDNMTGTGLIDWTFPGGITWTGNVDVDGSPGDGTSWNDSNNWSINAVPGATDYVILDHSVVTGSYSVSISGVDALSGNMSLTSPSNTITLTIGAGRTLDINGDLDIGANCTLTQTDNTSLITIEGSWSQASGSTFIDGSSTVTFNGDAVNEAINIPGSESFYNLTFNAPNSSVYTLGSLIDVSNDLVLTSGELDVSGGNYGVNIAGNWTVSGGTFTPRAGTVTFDRASGTQVITSGTFYNFTTSAGGTKQVASNIDINGIVTIGASTTLDGQTYQIYVGSSINNAGTNVWVNNSGSGAFTQTGAGEVIFDGGSKTFDNGSQPSTFNNITFSLNTNATANFSTTNATTINGNVIINAGPITVDLANPNINFAGGSNTLTINGTSTLNVRVTNLPASLENFVLNSSSTVRYLSDSNQNIFATTYGNLTIDAPAVNPVSTKTLMGNVVVLGTLDLDNDNNTRLDIGDYTLTLSGAIAVATPATNPGNNQQIQFNTGTGSLSTIIMDGTVGQALDPQMILVENLTMTGAAVKTMGTGTGTLQVNGDLSVSSGASLDMNVELIQGTPSGSFSLGAGNILYVGGAGNAFPQSFGTYSLSPSSSVTYDSGTLDQNVESGVTYGNLTVDNGDVAVVDKTAEGALNIDGTFTIAGDAVFDAGNFNHAIGGTFNYNPATTAGFVFAAGSTLTFDGGTADFNLAGGGTGALTIENMVVNNSGILSLGTSGGNDFFTITGNLTIGGSSTLNLTANRYINFSGLNWTNNGTFTVGGNGSIVYMNRDVLAETQTINPGVNTFGDLYLSGRSNKTFTGSGLDVNDVFNLDDALGAFTVDFGSLTHTYSGANNFIIDPTVSVTTASASFVYDGGTSTFPTLITSFVDLTISGTGTKTMSVPLAIDDLTINSGTTLATGGFGITLNGNFINAGTFTVGAATIAFESNNTNPKTITTGASSLGIVTFNQTAFSARTYSLGGNTTFTGALTLGNGATLDLNGKTFTIGNGSTHTLQSGSTLDVDALSSLRFNNTAANSTLDVQAGSTFNVVGTNSTNVATVTRSAGANRTAITIANTATVGARYYLFEFLTDAGLVVNASSVIDATNNFSDGIWSNISGAVSSRYLQLDYNLGPLTINNIQFNYAGTPPANVYNVARNASALTAVNFTGTVDGNLAGLNAGTNSLYELDGSVTMTWPVTTATTWTGAVDSDWNTAGNWNNGVPGLLTDALIPNVVNDPIISTGDNAQVKNLTVSDGLLVINSNEDLTVAQDIIIGSTGAGRIDAFGSAGTIISVGGNWTVGATGQFDPGGGLVDFTGTSGTKTIDNRGQTFDNILFSGTSNFDIQVTGTANIEVNGNLTVESGATVTLRTNNYNLKLAGNFDNNGTFNPTSSGVVGTVTLDGTGAQSINGGNFYLLTVSGSGEKSTTSSMAVANNLTVNSTLTAGGDFDLNGTVTIAAAGVFNDGGFSHTVTGNWTNSNAAGYAGTGTVTFDGAGINISASDFHNLIFAGTGTKTLTGDLDLTGSFTSNSTLTAVNLQTFTINGNGVGDVFTSNTPILYVRGTNNFPNNFSSYVFAATSTTYYDGNLDQTVRGDVNYGPMIFTGSGRTKTLDNPITITGNLTINLGCILDVSASNHSITITGSWTNTTGVFVARAGEVIFNGSAADQNINNGTAPITSDKYFYKLTVNTSGGFDVQPNNQGLTILNALSVLGGRFDPAGTPITIGGDLIVNGTGNLNTSNTITLNGAAGSYSISTNVGAYPTSVINNLVINAPGATYTLVDNLTINTDFTLTSGTLDADGNIVTLGNTGGGTKVASIQDDFILGPGGSLLLGNNTTLSVGNGAVLSLIGTGGSPVTISRNGAGTYSFQVNAGTIAAAYATFEYMNANGIYLTTSATLDATNNFANCSFTNGTAGGVLLRLEQASGNITIANVSFPTNPGGGAFNVQRTLAGSGIISFDPSSGAFTGESFDNDPSNLLSFPTPVTLTWNGSVSSDWFTAANWTPSVGGAIIPNSTTDVIIVTATNSPLINTSGAACQDMTVTSGTLTITTADASQVTNDLTISGDLQLDNGSIVVTANDDIIAIEGGFLRNTGGTFNNGSSTVRFIGNSSTKTINNGTAPFYNLEIAGSSTYQLGVNTTVTNNLIISGVLDVTTSNRNITLGGNFTNTGTFLSRTATVLLNATSGTKTITSGGSAFNNLTFSATGVTYQLADALSTKANTTITAGTLDLNGKTFNNGDNAGIDALSITGTLLIGANGVLSMGSSSTLTTNSGGHLSIVGTNGSNLATMTRQSAGSYSVTMSSGSTISAQYFLIEHTNASGIVVSAGATINATNRFQNGTFSNGAAGGTYLTLQNTLTNMTSANTVFNAGPSYNVTRPSGLTGNHTFQDASGSLGTETYNSDPDGQILFTSTFSNYTWDGSSSTDWHDPSNWDSNVVPGTGVNVIVPSGPVNQPIISTASATCRDLTIQLGGTLDLRAAQTLTIERDITISGTFLCNNLNSAVVINVAGNWTRTGTFTSGNGSTIVLNPSSGTKTFANGASSVRNLTINGTGGTTIQLSSNTTVAGNLTLQSGSFDVTVSNYNLNIAGDYTNSGGTLVPRSGTVTFNGTSNQNLTTGGTGAGKTFYNLTVNKLSGDLDVITNPLLITNQLNLSSGTLHANDVDITVNGNWNNTGGTYTSGNGTVTMAGSGTTTMNANTSTNLFNNLTIAKTGGGQLTLLANLNVNGNLTVTSGTLFANGKTLNFGDGADNFSIASGATVNVDAGSFMNFFGGTNNTVNGILRVVGLSSVNRATLSRRTSGNYSINFASGSTARFQFATVEYTGGNGLVFATGSTIDPSFNMATTTFQNGAGTAYLTLNNDQSLTMSSTTFTASAGPLPTYNAQTLSGSGAFVFNNYKGTLGGARYENDVVGTLGRGRIRWTFTETQAISANTTYTFGNDLLLNFTNYTGCSSVTVQLVDDFVTPEYNQAIIRHYIVTATGTPVAVNMTQYWGANDQNSQVADATLNFWRRTGSGPYVYTPFANDAVDGTNKLATRNGLGANLSGTWFLSNAAVEASLPVEFAGSTITARRGGIEVKWETESETGNSQWRIERSTVTESDSLDFGELGKLSGAGTTSNRSKYTFMDKTAMVGFKYKYRLVSIDYDGTEYNKELNSIVFEAPREFSLYHNYPNPFNPSTTIPIDVAKEQRVSMTIYNIMGQEIAILRNEIMKPGYYDITWDGRDRGGNIAATGQYFVRIVTDGYVKTQKMILLK